MGGDGSVEKSDRGNGGAGERDGTDGEILRKREGNGEREGGGKRW